MDTTFQLYTVLEQIYDNNTRKLVLQDIDGIVFVTDSSSAKIKENNESFRNLIENLQTISLSINKIPVLIQYNKRDLGDTLPINKLDAQLNTKRLTTLEAVAKPSAWFTKQSDFHQKIASKWASLDLAIYPGQASERNRTYRSSQ
jgi:signal recognition particle receptor subunit beta